LNSLAYSFIDGVIHIIGKLLPLPERRKILSFLPHAIAISINQADILLCACEPPKFVEVFWPFCSIWYSVCIVFKQIFDYPLPERTTNLARIFASILSQVVPDIFIFTAFLQTACAIKFIGLVGIACTCFVSVFCIEHSAGI